MRTFLAAAAAVATGFALLFWIGEPPLQPASPEPGTDAGPAAERAATALPNPFDGAASPEDAEPPAKRGATKSFDALAAHWAPAIENDTSRQYENDFITRVDFDGDWDATNNWANATGALPAAAYSWAVQTRTHVFLGYAFYRLANGQEPPEPNEMQGAMVVVRRAPGTDGRPTPDPGRFEAILIWSHGRYEVFAEHDKAPDDPELAEIWSTRLKPTGRIRNAARKVAGDINFVVDRFGVHPVLYAEADTHRLLEAPGGRPGGPGLFNEPLTDWRHKNYDQRKATAGESWGEMRGVPQDGVMYLFAGQSLLPVVDKSGKGRGRYKHHWEIVGYELLDLDALWNRRREAPLFVDAEAFAGTGRYRNLRLAPWAWAENAEGLRGLDPVRNPGALTAALVRLPPPFDPLPTARSFALEE